MARWATVTPAVPLRLCPLPRWPARAVRLVTFAPPYDVARHPDSDTDRSLLPVHESAAVDTVNEKAEADRPSGSTLRLIGQKALRVHVPLAGVSGLESRSDKGSCGFDGIRLGRETRGGLDCRPRLRDRLSRAGCRLIALRAEGAETLFAGLGTFLCADGHHRRHAGAAPGYPETWVNPAGMAAAVVSSWRLAGVSGSHR